MTADAMRERLDRSAGLLAAMLDECHVEPQIVASVADVTRLRDVVERLGWRPPGDAPRNEDRLGITAAIGTLAVDYCKEAIALRALCAKLVAVLREDEEYFDQRSDADLPQGAANFIPNEEMIRLGDVRDALKAAEAMGVKP